MLYVIVHVMCQEQTGVICYRSCDLSVADGGYMLSCMLCVRSRRGLYVIVQVMCQEQTDGYMLS